MKVKLWGLLAAYLLVLSQFFSYPANAQEASGSAQICCNEDLTVEIADNGPDSDNSLSLAQDKDSQTSQNNNLGITNNIKINAQTGDNQASDNDGNITIITGKVNSYTQISNYLNSSDISASKPSPKSSLKVSGNGSGSTSSLDGNINNNLRNYASTGKNKAKSNRGTVFISTGDVYLAAILSNITSTSKIIKSPWETQGLLIKIRLKYLL